MEALTQRHKEHKENLGVFVSLCENLEHHLRRYTRRSTSDFFIHKDLRGFLSRELDFYLKNEVLNLDELEAAGEGLAEGWFQLLRLIKRVGGHIIEFLAQIEDFQKMLWEKRKFITETFYVITVGNIPEAFYPEIAACEAQWEEWKELLHFDEEQENLFTAGMGRKDKRLEYLKAYPSLPLDTRRFPPDFTDRLLASCDNLDEMTDGLLVHSDSWQALNLLQEKYRGQVKCIHIDPPYNAHESRFLYKNSCRHSSWMTMMNNRFDLAASFITPNGHLISHIDENEYERLKMLLDMTGIPDAGTVIWDKRTPNATGNGVATQHEYIIWRSFAKGPIYRRNAHIAEMLMAAKRIIAKYGGVTEGAKKEYARWVRKHPRLSGGEKAYCHLDEQGRIYASANLGSHHPRPDPKYLQPLIHPKTGKPCPIPRNGFSRTPETLRAMMERGEILFGKDETVRPRRKQVLSEDTRTQVYSIILDTKRGKKELDLLALDFSYCHPTSLYETLISASAVDAGDIVLDYFAGSGTTGHAVINLNREDGVRRRFILVEMAHYFDTVLLPRIKKVTFSPEWKDGRPKRIATAEEAERGPRIVKVIRLESYEDALNNLSFDKVDGTTSALHNTEVTHMPFAYKLRIYRNGGITEQPVDTPETFNYLIGLNVEKRQVLNDGERRYLVYRGTTNDGQRVTVIWRDITGWADEDYRRDCDFVTAHNLTDAAVFVNGSSAIPGAQTLDTLFEAKIFTQNH